MIAVLLLLIGSVILPDFDIVGGSETATPPPAMQSAAIAAQPFTVADAIQRSTNLPNTSQQNAQVRQQTNVRRRGLLRRR
jgi:hypothetical protein